MPNRFGYSLRWTITIVAAALTGCSIHPIPDDVSRYSTEDIVRNVRCEAKGAVRDKIVDGLHKRSIYDIRKPDEVLSDKAIFESIRRRAPDLAAKFVAYGESVIAYDFDFLINENNDNTGAVTFNMPFASGGSFTLGLDGGVNKERKGHRTFKTVEKFKELVKLRCDEWVQPDRNILYPLTGSIGVDRVMTTFIEVSEIGGGQGVFSDVITFTTDVHGSVKPTLVLIPIVDRFRVINANADFTEKRKDVHQVTISLAFPEIDLREARSDRGFGANSISEPARDTRLRALERLCIATAEAREDRFGTLRQIPPQYYCRQSRGSP